MTEVRWWAPGSLWAARLTRARQAEDMAIAGAPVHRECFLAPTAARDERNVEYWIAVG